jgi:hypothetical protein
MLLMPAISLSAFQKASSRVTLTLRPPILTDLLTTADLRRPPLDGEILPMTGGYSRGAPFGNPPTGRSLRGTPKR